MEFERRRRGDQFVQIAPLVDVVFLLLLFFLLTYHLDQEERIRVALPESRTTEMREASLPTLTVTRVGDLYLNGRKAELESLQRALRNLHGDGALYAVHIRADREVPVGLLVQVIDQARLGGVRNLSIATERR